MPIIKLQPVHKNYVWGGNKLKQQFNMQSDFDIVAESWTLACHPDGESTQESTNQSLSNILKVHPEYLGKKASTFPKFPIMVKLIDAARELSIQVHPDDELGKKLENEYGKTEMWYVLDANPDAFLYYGFKEDMTKDEFKSSIEQGTILDKLNKVYVKSGDVFFVQAGIVHAIGAGIVIAEIQQNSNATYRIFDYNRMGVDGKPRPLHIEKALIASTLTKSNTPMQGEQTKASKTTYRELVSCPYFHVDKLDIIDSASIFVDGDSFVHVQVVEGDGYLVEAEQKKTPFQKGDSFFITADYGTLNLEGFGSILLTRV